MDTYWSVHWLHKACIMHDIDKKQVAARCLAALKLLEKNWSGKTFILKHTSMVK